MKKEGKFIMGTHKAIYQPKGAAREYSAWACNLYNGCSNQCDYCYCKRGVLSYRKTALLYSFSACAATHQATACIAGTLIRTRSAIGLFRSLTSRRGLPSNQKTLQFTAGGSSQHCGRNITLVRYVSRGEK